MPFQYIHIYIYKRLFWEEVKYFFFEQNNERMSVTIVQNLVWTSRSNWLNSLLVLGPALINLYDCLQSKPLLTHVNWWLNWKLLKQFCNLLDLAGLKIALPGCRCVLTNNSVKSWQYEKSHKREQHMIKLHSSSIVFYLFPSQSHTYFL